MVRSPQSRSRRGSPRSQNGTFLRIDSGAHRRRHSLCVAIGFSGPASSVADLRAAANLPGPLAPTDSLRNACRDMPWPTCPGHDEIAAYWLVRRSRSTWVAVGCPCRSEPDLTRLLDGRRRPGSGPCVDMALLRQEGT